MPRKRLVLFVEGEGDEEAAPVLVTKILNEMNAWEHLFLDDKCFRVGGVECVTGSRKGEWSRYLGAARKRSALGGVLALFDGDIAKVEGEPFCAMKVARLLSERARAARAGTEFSLACVFACCEYESWLIAGAESLCGKLLPPDNRPGMKAQVEAVPDTEARRGAKEWLSRNMLSGYKPTTDQEPLTRLLALEAVRQRRPRSFLRPESATRQLVDAIRTGRHIPLVPAT